MDGYKIVDLNNVLKNECICDFKNVQIHTILICHIEEALHNKHLDEALQALSLFYIIIKKEGPTCKTMAELKEQMLSNESLVTLMNLSLHHQDQFLRYLARKCVIHLLEEGIFDNFRNSLSEGLKTKLHPTLELINSLFEMALKKDIHPFLAKEISCKNEILITRKTIDPTNLNEAVAILTENWNFILNIQHDKTEQELMLLWKKCLQLHSDGLIGSINEMMGLSSLNYLIAKSFECSCESLSHIAQSILIEALRNKSLPWVSMIVSLMITSQCYIPKLLQEKFRQKSLLIMMKVVNFASEQDEKHPIICSIYKNLVESDPTSIIDTFLDQDDILFEILNLSLGLFLNLGPVLSQEINLNPHNQFLHFMRETGSDHQILMDLLLSEIEALTYLVNYLKLISRDWPSFKTAHQTMGLTMDSTMPALIRLRAKLKRSHKKDLLPYNVKPLLYHLKCCEQIYEGDS